MAGLASDIIFLKTSCCFMALISGTFDRYLFNPSIFLLNPVISQGQFKDRGESDSYCLYSVS
jgi:hypothetical protein